MLKKLFVVGVLLAAGGAGLGAKRTIGTEPERRTLPETVPEPAARALAAIGWRPEDLHFDRADVNLYGGGDYRLPIYDAWIDRPFVIPQDVGIFEKTLAEAVRRPSDLLMFAALRTGHGVRRGLIGDPAKELADSLPAADPLRRALQEIWAAAGHPIVDEGASGGRQPSRNNQTSRDKGSTIQDKGRIRDERGIREIGDAEKALLLLPPAWQRPVAWILTAEAEAIRWRRMATARVEIPLGDRSGTPDREDPSRWLYRESIRYATGLDSDTQDPAFQRLVETGASVVDLGIMQAGATDLLLVLQKAIPELQRAAEQSIPARPIETRTPAGLIRIGTAGPDDHPAADYLLLLDPAGDDRYEGCAAGTADCPVSVACDLSGNDRYASADSTRPAFGAGVTGIGILLDRSGDDSYEAENLSLGAGLCGIGVLADSIGNDRYDAFTTSEGAGLFGFGVLADGGGTDRYHGYQAVQGYGYTLGCGLLVDGGGNDRYEAEDQRIRFPSAQTREHNSSLAQGFGFGKRADFSDGHSLAGGFGMLVDASGDDTYQCGVFGQGAGYWYGTGVLADGGGNDTYEGIWYTQGSAAHFALGILWDGAGDDSYHATMNMAQGAGHDFSLGLLYDQSGRDLYRAPNLSLGGGNANGFGIFWDRSGDDRYEVAEGTTLGRSNVSSRGGLRDRMKNLGLFLDTAGRDQYPAAKPFAANGRLWTQAGTDTTVPLATEAGVGLDTEWQTASKEDRPSGR